MAFITPTAEVTELGGGVLRNTIHLAPVAYEDASGNLQAISDQWADGDAAYPHVISAARLRVRTAPNGDRLLLPVPGDDDAWFSISSPFINVGGSWTQPSLGSFSRTGNQLTATAANVITRINHAGHYIKAEYELLNGWTPANGQFAYRVGLNGLTRQGGTLLYNGVPVMQLRKPVAYDADNPGDTREITHEFVALGGQNYILFTLPSLAGMSRPVVDPTFSSQPSAATGLDTNLVSGADSGKNYGVDPLTRAGRTAAGVFLRGLVQFDISSIPAGATISSGTLTLYCVSEGSTTDYNVAAHRALTQWYEGIRNAAPPVGEDGSTWDDRNANGSVAWAGGAGGGSGSDYAASATDTTSITSASAAFNWTVTADVSAWYAGTATNYGWWLIGDEATAADTFKRFATSDNPTAGNRPQLVVEYTASSAIPVVMHHRRQQGMS